MRVTVVEQRQTPSWAIPAASIYRDRAWGSVEVSSVTAKSVDVSGRVIGECAWTALAQAA